MFENYLLKDFKNHVADLGPVLVDTCFYQLSDVRIEPWTAGWETPRLLLSKAIFQLIKFFKELSTTGPGYSESKTPGLL